MIHKYEYKILDVIRKHEGWIGATDIGLRLGFDYADASAKCAKALKSLKRKGLIGQEPHKKR